jgi:cytochrome c oxidase assembly factor CtaG
MSWDWEPSVVIGCAALSTAYVSVVRPRTAFQALAFLSGTLLLVLSLVSPLDLLADRYLFSAHVLQHLLLALIIPPLWLLGMPTRFVESALRYRAIRRCEHSLKRSAIAWPAGVVTMLAWHIPVLFNTALANEPLHIFQHLSFLVTGVIFWWPVLSALDTHRLPPLSAIIYLFSACTACSLLGAILTFTPPGWYPAYVNPTGESVRTGWGLDPRTDQQLGGMLMWVPGCLVYLTAILTRVARWYATPERA